MFVKVQIAGRIIDQGCDGGVEVEFDLLVLMIDEYSCTVAMPWIGRAGRKAVRKCQVSLIAVGLWFEVGALLVCLIDKDQIPVQAVNGRPAVLPVGPSRRHEKVFATSLCNSASEFQLWRL